MDTMSSNLEDYLETIFALEAHHKEAKAKDIADALGTISYEVLCLFGGMNPRVYG